MNRLALLLGLSLLALSFGGCAGGDVHLTGQAGEMFRKLTGASAITPSEKVTIYGTENPPDAVLQCHENVHREQSRVIADALTVIGAVDDDDFSRMMAWISVYSIEHIQRGYQGNKFEIEARETCRQK